MPLWKQKYTASVKILKQIAFCLLIGGGFLFTSQCSLIRAHTAKERSDKVNKRIERKREKQYKKAKEAFREKHYERQAERVQKRMDYNASQSEAWREKQLRGERPSFFRRIGEWFSRLIEWFDRPEKGLFK